MPCISHPSPKMCSPRPDPAYVITVWGTTELLPSMSSAQREHPHLSDPMKT